MVEQLIAMKITWHCWLASSCTPSHSFAAFLISRAEILSYATNLLSEMIGTFVLVFVVGAMFSKATNSGRNEFHSGR
jgi:glycerol uptake facilitator-like aquaporin